MVRVTPFPYRISIGTDICRIPRITRLIVGDEDGESTSRFMRRILTPPETSMVRPKLNRYLKARQADADGGRSQVTQDQALHELSQWLAGRFAAKEATKKAYVSRRLGWKEICVRTESCGRPYVLIGPPQAFSESVLEGLEDAPKEHGTDVVAQVAQLSISHDGEYAIATVMVAAQPAGSDGVDLT